MINYITDYQGNKLDYEDNIYLTEDGLVKENEFSDYVGLVYANKMTVEEYINILNKSINSKRKVYKHGI